MTGSMRLLAGQTFCALVAVGALIAGCSGGSQTLPASTSGSGTVNAQHPRTNARLYLRVPPKPRASHRRGPRYVSWNTRSLRVTVTSLASPAPAPLSTLLVVATPKPCTGSATSGYACQYAVRAYVGKDVFQFDAYASQSPGPNATPLSTYTSGTVTVNAQPSPLSFSLDGVVQSVVLSVASPEAASGAYANAQSIPIGSATSVPLYVTPLDASGATIATGTFAGSGITLSTSNQAGVTLSLQSQCPNDRIVSPTQVVITCAADLAHVWAAYDGTPHPQGTGTYYDSATISASPQPAGTSSTPPAAVIALASALRAFTLPYIGNEPSLTNLTLDPVTDKLILGVSTYADDSETATLMQFDPSNPQAAPDVAASMKGMVVQTVYADRNGDIWAVYSPSQQAYLDCYTSITASPVQIVPSDASLFVNVLGLTQDGAGNVWYVGSNGNYDLTAGFVPSPNGCPRSGSSSPLFVLGNGSFYEAAPWQAGGGIYALTIYPYDIYALPAAVPSNSPSAPPSTPPSPSPSPVVTPPPSYAFTGITSDPSFSLYIANAVVSSGGALRGAARARHRLSEPPAPRRRVRPSRVVVDPSEIDVIQSGGTRQRLVSLPIGAEPYSVQTYAGSATSAQIVAAGDDAYDAIVLVDPAKSSTTPLEVPVPSTLYVSCTNPAFDTAGSLWEICAPYYASSGATSQLYHLLVTSTWAPFVEQPVYYGGYAVPAIVGIAEVGANSAPFTLSGASGVLQLPTGAVNSHVIAISVVHEGSTTLTVTDKYGRSQTVPVTIIGDYGAGHGARTKARPRTPHP